MERERATGHTRDSCSFSRDQPSRWEKKKKKEGKKKRTCRGDTISLFTQDAQQRDAQKYRRTASDFLGCRKKKRKKKAAGKTLKIALVTMTRKRLHGHPPVAVYGANIFRLSNVPPCFFSPLFAFAAAAGAFRGVEVCRIK